MQHVKTLILGATFYGLSAFSKEPESSLVLERTCLAGSEFADSFKQQSTVCNQEQLKSCFSRNYFSALKKDGFVSEEGIAVSAPALFFLCEQIQHLLPHIYFGCEVLGIETKGSIFEVEISGKGGTVTVSADRIIDTTSAGVLHRLLYSSGAKKYLNVLMSARHTDFPGKYCTYSNHYI